MKATKFIVERFTEQTEIGDLFDDVESLRAMYSESIESQKTILNVLDDHIDECIEKLIANNICPECGGEMEQVETGHETWVPYGDRMVLESVETKLKCASCGFSKEE